MDTTEIVLPYGEGPTATPVQKFRDNLKYLTAMEDDTAAKSHREAAKARAEKRKGGVAGSVESGTSGKEHGHSSGEYLSGFYKEDRLVPVITLVLFFSPKPWDGPMSIHDMLTDVRKDLLPFIPDYRINLIAPAEIDEAAMEQFKTSLREVLLYIKYSGDKKQLEDLLNKDPHFSKLDTEAAIVINTLTNSKLKFDRKGKSVNMCVAVREMRQEERQEGR